MRRLSPVECECALSGRSRIAKLNPWCFTSQEEDRTGSLFTVAWRERGHQENECCASHSQYRQMNSSAFRLVDHFL